jgi:hypothetical protein
VKQEAIKQELERIAAENGGVLYPGHVVNAARPVASPLHSQFEWDDSEAAEKYRLHQARQLISVVVQYIGNDPSKEPVPVFVSLRSDRGQRGGYRTIVSVLSDEGLRQQLLEDALAELETFRKKYGHLRELARVFAASRKVRTKQPA